MLFWDMLTSLLQYNRQHKYKITLEVLEVNNNNKNKFV